LDLADTLRPHSHKLFLGLHALSRGYDTQTRTKARDGAEHGHRTGRPSQVHNKRPVDLDLVEGKALEERKNQCY
jgi:hypothetical protein